jgi:hypothetical protein
MTTGWINRHTEKEYGAGGGGGAGIWGEDN